VNGEHGKDDRVGINGGKQRGKLCRNIKGE